MRTASWSCVRPILTTPAISLLPALELLQQGDDLAFQAPQHADARHAQGRRVSVVGGLVQVDVVDGVDRRVVAQRPAQQLQGPVGQDLVDVHVGGGARPALEGVDDDVPVEHSLHHLGAGGLDGLERRLIPPAQFVVGAGAGQFHGAVAVDEGRMHRPPSQRKVLEGPLGMDAVKGRGRDLAAAEEVVFGAIFCHLLPFHFRFLICDFGFQAQTAPRRAAVILQSRI